MSEAGKRPEITHSDVEDAIQQSVTAALTALRAKVEGLETFEPFMEIGDDEKVVLRAAVLAVIDEAMPK